MKVPAAIPKQLHTHSLASFPGLPRLHFLIACWRWRGSGNEAIQKLLSNSIAIATVCSSFLFSVLHQYVSHVLWWCACMYKEVAYSGEEGQLVYMWTSKRMHPPLTTWWTEQEQKLIPMTWRCSFIKHILSLVLFQRCLDEEQACFKPFSCWQYPTGHADV